MPTNRLEAFSDGVIAIIITIMVLQMKVPAGSDWAALSKVFPVFISYLLSFIYIGIFWTNHHHLLHITEKVTGPILWANLHLLFWQSLVPFTTEWMGANHFTSLPTALYGFVLFMSALSYQILQHAITTKEGRRSRLGGLLRRDRKGLWSILAYLLGIGLAFVSPWLAAMVYVFVAILWFLPDPRIEQVVERKT